MAARPGPNAFCAVASLFLLSFHTASPAAEPLCGPRFERSVAIASRKAYEEFSAAFPQYSSTTLRERFGDGSSQSFVFTNRSRRHLASHLLLVLPGSGFHPAYMLQALERTVPDDTEVAVLEYPYLGPGFDPDGPFADSGQIAAWIATSLAGHRRLRPYDRVGIYASSMGGSLVAKILQSGTRVDFLVLDGIQESRPLPFFCNPKAWLRGVLPPLL